MCRCLPTVCRGRHREALSRADGPVTTGADASAAGGVLHRAKQFARTIKRDTVAVWIASRDPRVPWYVKLLAAIVAAYALSPIDLIPDFIPVLGYVDDIVIVPAGILLTARLIPDDLMNEFRTEAAQRGEWPGSRMGAAGIVLLWIGAIALTAWWLLPSDEEPWRFLRL